ncbi:MAG: TetR family transcriptional regulator [Chloroflexi bacterium]|nr:TetR family transcriptional regulator [Chloroflexota bacterium]
MRRTKEEALQTRGALLRAAADIVVGQGAGSFTLEAVAQHAGVTKGGLLHHFPSKEALVDGLIDDVLERFASRLQVELANEAEGQPGHWMRAYIRMMLAVQDDDFYLIPTLAAIVVSQPATIERIRSAMLTSQQAAAHDGIDPTRATIIRLAVDGLLFTRAFHLDVVDDDIRRDVLDALIGMTRASGED